MKVNDETLNLNLNPAEAEYRNASVVEDLARTDEPLVKFTDYESSSVTETNIQNAELEREQEAQAEALSESKTFGEWVDTADSFNDLFYSFKDDVGQFEADPEFDLRKDEKAKEWYSSLQTDKYRTYFEESAPQSREEAEALHKVIAQKEKDEQDLATIGWKGAGAHFLANFNDPEEIGLTVASSVVGLGIANSLFTTGRAGLMAYRANRVIRGATSGLTEGVLMAGTKLAGNDLYTLSDAVLEVSAGAALGTLGGALAPTRHQRLLDELIANGKHERAAVLRDQMNRQLAADGLVQGGLNRLASINQAAANLGDMARSGITDFDTAMSQMRAEGADVQFAGWRWDLYSYTQKSKSKTFNALGRILLSDPVNGSGKGMGADLSADREAAWFIGRVFEKSVGIFKKAKSVDGNINRDNFGSEVWKQTEYGGSSNPHVQAMADMMQEHYRLMLNRLKAAGVEGAEFISTGGKYQPRIWNRDIHDKIKTGVMSEDAVRSAIRNAYANMVDATVTPETIDKVVDAIVENGLKIKDDVDFTTHFSSVMKGVDPRFKRRINLDMSATSDDGSVSIADLVETNSFKLYESYMRKMSGRLALAERGIKSYDQLAELRNTIGKELREAGEDPKKTMDMLDDIEDALQGHAARRMAREGYADWMRQTVKGAKSLSALNMLGSAAFAMIPEFVAASAEVGFAHVIKQMPILRSMGNKHRKLVMNQLDYMAVNMTDGQWNNYFTADVLDGTKGTKVNRTFDDINRFTYKASLMNAGERFTRNTFINAGVSRIGKEMRKNGKLKETTRRALGLSKEDTEYLEAQLRQHMKTKKGFFGTEVEDLAPDSWRTADGKVDVKAHRIMADGLQKLANTATARSTAGERINWIDGTVQSFWLQFQNTVINSWQRVVLRGLGGTKEQAAGHVLGVIMGGLAAWGMTTTRDNLRTFGNAEAQRKLRDRTGAEKIARNMSYVPALGALYAALEKSSFLYTWGTGETFDGFRYESAETALFSMPALSLLENTIAMPHRLMEGDIDAAIRGVPMQSWYLFKPILNVFRNW